MSNLPTHRSPSVLKLNSWGNVRHTNISNNMARVWDVTLEDTCLFFKGLPPKIVDPFITGYTDEFNNIVPSSLQHFCLATIVSFDSDTLQTALALLPSRLSKQVENLLQSILERYVNHSRGCWVCYGKENEHCPVCDTCERYYDIQTKHKAKKMVSNGTKDVLPVSTSISSSNEDFYKLTIVGLDHMVGNKLVQKLLGDLLYGQFCHVTVHYVCVVVGDWERFRQKTTDRAFVVLKGLDSKKAANYLINLFKNPILKNITMVPTRNQELYPGEITGGFIYRNQKKQIK